MPKMSAIPDQLSYYITTPSMLYGQSAPCPCSSLCNDRTVEWLVHIIGLSPDVSGVAEYAPGFQLSSS